MLETLLIVALSTELSSPPTPACDELFKLARLACEEVPTRPRLEARLLGPSQETG
jgi:hypothetical protein